MSEISVVTKRERDIGKPLEQEKNIIILNMIVL
jgi:hypothetical protein